MITQRWGTNGEWYRANDINIDGHNGYDFKCVRGEPVYHSATFDGVVKTEVDSRGGIGVRVHSKKQEGDLGFVSVIYWHLQKVDVFDGQEVRMGDRIGFGDSTGFSTGDHVHFALKQVNERGRSINIDNGYFGAIDPTPYFDVKFILDELDRTEDTDLRIRMLKLKIQILRLKIAIQRLINSRK